MLISQPNPKKQAVVSKITEKQQIGADSKDQLYPIRINQFVEVIPIEEQGVIKHFKNYVFDRYQHIQYREKEAIQVFFHREKGHFAQKGYLIIEKDTKAIMALQYATQPMKDVMKSTVGKSMRYTDLDSHRVELNYGLNADNLYAFESGIYHVQYTNRWKSSAKSIVLNSNLKKTQAVELGFGAGKPIDQMFIE